MGFYIRLRLLLCIEMFFRPLTAASRACADRHTSGWYWSYLEAPNKTPKGIVTFCPSGDEDLFWACCQSLRLPLHHTTAQLLKQMGLTRAMMKYSCPSFCFYLRNSQGSCGLFSKEKIVRMTINAQANSP